MPREYQPIAPEDLERVRERDSITDQIYDLRRKRVDLYAHLIKYLPMAEGQRRMRPEVLSEAVEAGQKLDALLDWDVLQKEAKAQGWSKAKLRAEKDEILEGMELVLAWTKRIKELESSKEAVGHFGMREKEMAAAEDAMADFETRRVEEEEALEYTTGKPGLRDAKQLNAIRRQRVRIKDLEREKNEYIATHPEAYYLAQHRELEQIKQAFDKTGKIVETPYVRKKIELILSNLRRNTPVFIHGELGTGKTELAMHIARTRLSAPHLQRWEANNPMPDAEDREALAHWAAERAKQADPIVVHGHRGMESEEMTFEREIAPGEAPSPEEQVRLIEQGWKRFLEDTQRKAEEAGKPLAPDRIKRLEDDYREAYKESFKSPIETRRSLRGVLQAMREGRPVIIDEMNAIPHHVLIVLNDYLMRKPGDVITPPFPDIPPFEVKEGFAVMATGNYKPEDGELYQGRQRVDAAFLSRFAVMNYDYLPGKNQLEPEGMSPEDQRKFRRENELLLMMLARLLDRRMSLNLPQGALRQMEKLAMVARGIQDVFSGAEVGNAWFATDGTARVKPQEILKENVLSLRHLLRVLDRWHAEGYQYPLDVYLFEDYVARSSARPKEMRYLYEMLQTQGDFFRDADGWPAFARDTEVQNLDVNTIKERYHEQLASGDAVEAPIETLSERQVIEKMFGPAPARTLMAEDEVEIPVEFEPAQDLEAEIERQEALAMLGSVVSKADEMNGQDYGQDYHM